MGEPATFRQDDFLTGAEPAYLVTGATGFLGRHLLEILRKHAPAARLILLVRGLKSWEAQTWRGDVGQVELIVGPLSPTDSWKNDPRLARLDGIFHLAGEVKHSRTGISEMFHTNVLGTEAMVRLAAEKGCRIMVASTSGTVGCSAEAREGPDETAPYCEEAVSRWPYYGSKILAEKRARALAEELNVSLIIVRPPVILGPGDHRFRSTGNVLRLLRGKLPFIFRGTMHFVDVRDVAEAMVRAMLLANPRPIYNLPGTVLSLDEFFGTIADEAHLPKSWRVLPAKLIWLVARTAELLGIHSRVLPNPVVIEMGEHHWELSSRYASAELGFKPRPARQTIRDTVDWLRENHPDLTKNTS